MEEENIVHSFSEEGNIAQIERKRKKWVYVFWGWMLIGGIVTGFLVVQGVGGLKVGNDKLDKGSSIKGRRVVGKMSEKTDSAEGVLEKGGIDGEGTHHLVREGGPAQTVYLTSSVLDLNEFVGRKVKVWGETFAAEKAGWLMDVGRVEILE